MSNNSLIVEGPPLVDPCVPEGTSLGTFLIEKLRNRNPTDILHIDAVTGKTQTCRELYEDAIRTVHILKGLGMRKDDVMALLSENTITYSVPVLAALCMGVIINPLNPSYTIGELRHVLQISKPKVIFCTNAALGNIEHVRKEFDFIKTVIIMGNKDNCVISKSVEIFESLLENVFVKDFSEFEAESFDVMEQGAYIFLSSGTTGLPKGVLLTHGNFYIPFSYMRDPSYFAHNDGDILTAVLPYFHIYGTLMYYVPLCLRTTLIVFQKFDLQEYFSAIDRYKINRLYVVPALLGVFANKEVVSHYDLTSIEDIHVGGTSISNEALEKVLQNFPNVKIKNTYGLTETSACCVYMQKNPGKLYCIGRLVPTVQAKVWDWETGKELGCCEVGELCFKGSIIMKRYYGIPNTTSVIDENGYFHTGDLGYYDQEGLFYMVGRTKDIIKYKSFQVSPTELELLLLSHKDIKDCAVVGIPDERAGQLPLACVVRQLNSNATEEEITDFVAGRVSHYKRLRGGVKFVEEIPRNPGGKILRRKLEEILNVNGF